MDEIIIRALQGRATSEEEEALGAWRQELLENERYYRAMTQAWRLVGLIEPNAAATPRLTRTVSPRAQPFAARAIRRAPALASRASAIVLTAAATLVLGLGIGLFWQLAEEAPRFAADEFVTGPGEMVTTRLSDGTVVRLGPSSRLRVNEGGPAREVWLDGHAFFAVAGNIDQRFVVRTRAGDAVVLGTRFDVQVEDDGMQVFVIEGRVVHQAGGGEVEVGPMEVSRASDGSAPNVQSIDDAGPLLSWLGEFLVFQSTPIREVARELSRRFAVQVHVADGRVASRTVTAWFTDETLDQILLIVCRAAEAYCMIRGDTVSIEP